MYADGLEALGKYTQVKYVNCNQRTKGFIGATDQGCLNVYASDGAYDKIVE